MNNFARKTKKRVEHSIQGKPKLNESELAACSMQGQGHHTASSGQTHLGCLEMTQVMGYY